MSRLRERHLYGAGAAACAVCCAAPLVGLLGLAGVAATAFTLVFAGLTFSLVVGGVAMTVTLLRRRVARPHASPPQPAGPVDVELGRRGTH